MIEFFQIHGKIYKLSHEIVNGGNNVLKNHWKSQREKRYTLLLYEPFSFFFSFLLFLEGKFSLDSKAIIDEISHVSQMLDVLRTCFNGGPLSSLSIMCFRKVCSLSFKKIYSVLNDLPKALGHKAGFHLRRSRSRNQMY